MHEDSPILSALGDDDRMLMSPGAVAARRNAIESKRLARWGISSATVDEVRAAIDKTMEDGAANIHDVLGVMDTLILDLAIMSIPLGFDPATSPETMTPLPGWRKQ